jgi:hypothetical protein
VLLKQRVEGRILVAEGRSAFWVLGFEPVCTNARVYSQECEGMSLWDTIACIQLTLCIEVCLESTVLSRYCLWRCAIYVLRLYCASGILVA